MDMKNHFQLCILTAALSLGLVAGCNRAQDGAAKNDAQVATDVQAKINADNSIPDKQITVNSTNGVVTLSGTVASEAERLAASNDAGSVPGVKTVINNLQTGTEAGSNMAPNASESEAVNNVGTRRSTYRRRTPSRSYSSAPASSQASNMSSAPPTPPQPLTLTVPAGTNLTIRTIDALDSERNQVGDRFSGTLDAPLEVDGHTAIPQGADVRGRVVDVKSAAHFTGASLLVLELTDISYNGHTYRITTDRWQKQGAARGKNTAEKVGGGAALGAVIGALAGGGKGAAIGAGVGAGVGTGAQAVTHGQQIQLRPESLLSFNLSAPVTVTAASSNNSGRQRLSPDSTDQPQ